jgi:hypothetical protein
MADEFRLPPLKENPTPEERARYVVLRLEQFIREGRTIDEGMSFRQWQAMSESEIATHIAEAENAMQKDDVVTKRLLFTTAAALVTVGFWGTAVSLHKTAYLVGAIVIGAAGLVLLAVAGEWRLRKTVKARQARTRRQRLARIESLNRRIKRMERALEKEEETLEKMIKEKRKELGG